jgi:hypothetical protein
MTLPVQIIVVGVPETLDIASNKRVYRREPAQPIPHKNGQWPLNHPVPDPETRRHLDHARREIANSRPEIARELTTARRELARCRPEIERFLRGGSGL